MRSVAFEDIAMGDKWSFDVEVTEASLDLFREISGDNNPLHCDADYARERGFKGRVAYGMLTASFYSQLVGVWLPGELCLLNEVDAQFRRPVYPGDLLTVSGEVALVRAELRLVRVRARIVNQCGEVVSTAKIQLTVRER